MKEIFGQRLRNVRQMRGLSMEDLSGRLSGGVTKQAISNYEAGKMLPRSSVLLQLADSLDVNPDYFFRPFSMSLSGIEFRRKTSVPVKTRRAVERQVLDYLERCLEIEDICGLLHGHLSVPASYKVSHEEDVRSLVSLIRSGWRLGDEGIVNVISLLEGHGIKVVEIDGIELSDALGGKAGEDLVIIIGKSSCPERKRFSILIELGHLLMTFDEAADERKRESLCRLFAGEFLIPRRTFMACAGEMMKGFLNIRRFSDIQRSFGISVDDLLQKALDDGLITESRYRYYLARKKGSLRLKEYIDESRYMDEHPSRFESLVHDAYAREIISVSKAAALLNTSVDHVLSTDFVL